MRIVMQVCIYLLASGWAGGNSEQIKDSVKLAEWGIMTLKTPERQGPDSEL